MRKKQGAYALTSFYLLLNSLLPFAQCPSSVGAVGSPVISNGSCHINIQFAIPNSTVSIYNASGLITQGIANSSGNATISYPCSANPVTSITSVVSSPVLQICNEFTITPIQILPVKVSSFTATLNDQKKAVINWTTVFEINGEEMAVEKSADGYNFKTIRLIKCMESSVSEKKYTYEDFTFSANSSACYRIKLADITGNISYSKTIYVSDHSGTPVSLYPNPLRSGNSFYFIGVKPTDINIKNVAVTDLAGRNIPFNITSACSIELSTSAPPGIYLVRFSGKVLKLIRE